MERKGLNSELILAEAVKLIEETGYDRFSLHELAARLRIKTASLYNHLNGLKEINLKLGEIAVDRLYNVMKAAVDGKRKDEALRSAAYAYRDFANNNPELYKAIIRLPALHDEKLDDSSHKIIQIIFEILDDYNIGTRDKAHYVRGLRSALHGFVSLQEAGFFSKTLDIGASFDRMIDCFIQPLQVLEPK